MRRYLVGLVLLAGMFSCGDDSTENGGGSHTDLFDKYKDITLPFTIADSTFEKKFGDTVGYTAFTQAIPDTAFKKEFPDRKRLSIYPLGKIEQKSKESYLITGMKDNNKAAIYICVFDKGKFTTSMKLIENNKNEFVNTASIDKRLSISISREWSVKDVFYYNRTIYAYNNVGVFTTVLTETNEDAKVKPVSNPYDTFPKKYKYSGDYSSGSKNVMFLRDGSSANEYLFYIRFQNEDDCGGEVRGRLRMTTDKAGEYSGQGDPCILNFNFSSNEVSVKETGTCGNYRGIKCFFNHTYTRKKEKSTTRPK